MTAMKGMQLIYRPPEPLRFEPRERTYADPHEPPARAHADPHAATADTLAVPARPPRAWFDPPGEPVVAGAGLSIDDDGRVLGRLFSAELPTTLIDGRDRFVPAASPTGGAGFHQSSVTCGGGEAVRAGLVSAGHLSLDAVRHGAARSAPVADPRAYPIVARVHSDEHGDYIAGALRPGLTRADVDALRLASLSGHWAPMAPEWLAAHGAHVAASTPTATLDLVGVALVEEPANLRPDLTAGRPGAPSDLQARLAAAEDRANAAEAAARTQHDAARDHLARLDALIAAAEERGELELVELAAHRTLYEWNAGSAYLAALGDPPALPKAE